MSDVAIKKWGEFLEWIDTHSGKTCYRGHSNKEYLLLPSVGRKNYSLGTELNMFEHFKRRANMYCNAQNDFEWLALAQHHGLPTRLLDWTENPLVACFFVVIENLDKDGRIYKINYRDDDFVNFDEIQSPFKLHKIEFLNPPISTRRIELQKGLFTIHPLPNYPTVINSDRTNSEERNYLEEIQLCRQCDLDFKMPDFNSKESIEESKIKISEFEHLFYRKEQPYFDIPNECKEYFEKKIRSLGIDETIYGDIDSIAKNIKYLGNNNLLREVKYISVDDTKPFWNAKIPQLLKDYIRDKPNDMLSLFSDFKIIDSNITFHIENVNETHYNIKEVTGILYYHIRPNYEKSEIPIFKDIFHSDYQTIIDFFKDLEIDVYNGRIKLHQYVKLKLYTEGYKENVLSVTKCDIIPTPEINEHILYFNPEFISAQDKMEYLLQQIDEKDISELKKTAKESETYNSIIEKYRSKINDKCSQ